MLNGISDDKLEIGERCIDFLETHGNRMKEAMKALGEDEEEEIKEPADKQESQKRTETASNKRTEVKDTEMKVNE